jgi:hypothetical protein
MRTIAGALCALLLCVAGCGNSNCKSACDKLSSCGLKSSGLSCDSSCGTQDVCARCVNDNDCGSIAKNCAGDCPGVTFQ